MLQPDNCKREQIKQAARELFFQFGFSKTSMDDIARQSSFAKASLYYYFGSKEAIFDEIVLEEAALFMDRVEAEIDPALPADQRLALFFRLIYHHLRGYAQKMAAVPAYLCDYSPHGKPIVNQINDMFQQRLIPLLQAGQKAGVFKESDAAVLASTLVCISEFLNLEWIQSYPESQQDGIVETMIDIVLTGVKRRNT